VQFVSIGEPPPVKSWKRPLLLVARITNFNMKKIKRAQARAKQRKQLKPKETKEKKWRKN